MRTRVAPFKPVIALTVAALTLTACGGGAGDAAEPSKKTPVTVKAGFIPVIDVAALYLGQEKGFFSERGIDLKISTGQGGAALVPPVVSGEYQFAFSNMVSILTARAKGLPLKIMAAGSSSTGVEGKDVTMIHAAKGSGITSAEQLEGKKVAVNTVGNLMELLGSVGVDAAGGDSSKVKFVELGFPEALAAMKSGEIDAMVGAEPFDTIASSSGHEVISSPYLSMSKSSMLTSAYFTSESQLKKNPKLFEAIRGAIDESLAYAQKHPDEVRTQVSKFTDIDKNVLDEIALPSFRPEIPKESVELFDEYARKYKILDKSVSYDDVVWRGEQ
ncbi:ABC transporter substrate-binding protein [Streptomyces halstedii]|uniref:ABC transporter substrate-binding protein n=1 Tax=Streptomyces halstedii TaxID=1944 RepID=UPI0036513365